MHEELLKLGWSAELSDALRAEPAGPGEVPARVVRQDRGWLSLDTGTAIVLGALAGRLRHHAASAVDLPVIGDWVLIGDRSGSDGSVVINRVLPRHSVLLRRRVGGAAQAQPLAANVHVALIVVGLDHEPNLALLDRAIVMVAEGRVEPIVVLNKADMCADREAQVRRVRGHLPDLPVLAVSAVDGDGTDVLPAMLGVGRTATLIGPSGVGKSSLTNRLLGSDVMQTGAVRDHDRKGRHVTTHRQLSITPQGTLLIDGPGVRELGVWGAEDAVDAAFPEVVAAAAHCVRRACQHTTESGCAVQAGLRKGSLSARRVEGYRTLLLEISTAGRHRPRRPYRRGSS